MRGGKKKQQKRRYHHRHHKKKTNPRNQGKEEEEKEKKDKDISYIQEALSKERPEKKRDVFLGAPHAVRVTIRGNKERGT